MRIGVFSECYPPVQNGISVSVETLVDELRARHHRVFVVAPHFPDHDDQSPFVIRVPSLLTPFNPYPLAYPIPPQFRRKLGRVPPHVIHSHNPFVLGILAQRFARQQGLPLVSTYHTLYSHYGHYIFFLPHHTVQNLLEWWLPEYYNDCASVIAPSSVAEESLRGYGVTARIRVIPTGVPLARPEALTAEARAAVRDQWSIQHDVPLLVYVGRVAPEKNPEMVLDAFGAIAEEFADARLLVVGSGPHLETCRKLAGAMPVAERIVFAGAVPHEELEPVYAAADLFVFGSSTETQGLVVAEARAAGTPCVVVRKGCASETVTDGDDGLVVEPTLEAFSEALRSLLRDRPRLAVMRDACLRNAHRFTPSAMTDRVIEEYALAIEQHQAKAPAA